MLIESNNLLIIGVVLFALSLIFLFYNKKRAFIVVLILALLMLGRTIVLKCRYAQSQLEYTNVDIETEEGSSDEEHSLDINLDGIKPDIDVNIEEALPTDRYYIDETKKGFGLDYSTQDEIAQKIRENIEEFIEGNQ